MEKNVAGKWIVFAYGLPDHANPGEAITGDAANITANIRIDGGAANAVDDTNPTELEDGYYIFDITDVENDGNNLLLAPASSTANVQVIAVPGAVWTRPPNFNDLGIETDGDLTQVNSCVANTDMRGTDSGALASVCTEARLAELAAANMPADLSTIIAYVDELETRLTAARAGYLDALNGHIAQTGDGYAIVNDSSFGNAKLVRSTTPANTLNVTSNNHAESDINAIDGNTALVNTLKEHVGSDILESDTAQAGSANTITLAAGASSVDDFWNDFAIYLNGGTGVGQWARVEDYNGTTKVATIQTAVGNWQTNPDATTTYVITSAGALIHVSEIHQAALTSISGEIDANSILADWANGGRLDLILDVILVDTDATIPGLITALNNISSANVLTQINAALDTAIAELGVGVPSATPSVRTALILMYMALRNKLDVQTSGTDSLEVHNDAGTKIAEKLVTDDGTDYSEAKMT